MPTIKAFRGARECKRRAGGARRGVVSRADTGRSSDKGSAANQGTGWDFSRFVRTVAYFNAPRDVLQGVLQTALAPLQRPAAAVARPYLTWVGRDKDDRPATLVTGASGGLGLRVVRDLLARGDRVRVLVRDLAKSERLLTALPFDANATLEAVAADLSQPRTLQPAMFNGVRRLINCAAVKIRPEGSDKDEQQAKYAQGIKFFDPKIADESPEAVESRGVAALLQLVKPHLGVEAGVPILDPRDAATTWGALDDVVMGGASESGLFLHPAGGPDGEAVVLFRGAVSVANNGGFASVRSRNWTPPLDVAAYEGLRVTLRGDGQRYKFILRCDAGWDSVCYCLSVDTPKDEWKTLELPFSAFQPVFRARRMPGAAPLDPARISSLQIMLSKFEYDGALNPAFAPGAFSLPVLSISAYLDASTPRVVHVGSAGVTRPGRPGLDVDAEPPAVKLNDALGGLLTHKLAGEDAVRALDVPYAIVRPCALTEEPAGMPVQIDQGDTMRGKIGRDDVAALCVALLNSRAAVNTTFEVSSTVPFSQPWTGPPAGGAEAGVHDWEAALEAAELRQGVTGKTVNGVYTGRQPEAEVDAAVAGPRASTPA